MTLKYRKGHRQSYDLLAVVTRVFIMRRFFIIFRHKVLHPVRPSVLSNFRSIFNCLTVSEILLVFTVRRYALHGLWDRNSVCLSVRHTRGLCPHGSTYGRDFFTVW